MDKHYYQIICRRIKDENEYTNCHFVYNKPLNVVVDEFCNFITNVIINETVGYEYSYIYDNGERKLYDDDLKLYIEKLIKEELFGNKFAIELIDEWCGDVYQFWVNKKDAVINEKDNGKVNIKVKNMLDCGGAILMERNIDINCDIDFFLKTLDFPYGKVYINDIDIDKVGYYNPKVKQIPNKENKHIITLTYNISDNVIMSTMIYHEDFLHKGNELFYKIENKKKERTD